MISISLFIPELVLSQSNWQPFNTATKNNAGGLNVTIKYPKNYELVSQYRPFVIQEFNKIDLINRKISYLTISYIPIDNNFINSFLKKSDGTWNKPRLSSFFINLHGQTRGLSSYNESLYKNFPSVNVKFVQSESHPYQIYRLIDIKDVLYKQYIIKLECGDLSDSSISNEHENNFVPICLPFFNSLSFN
jgi:hypothetical protein